jgi:hypothetical protein
VTKNSGSTNNVATVVVLANDSDADGTLDPTTVTLSVSPTPAKGTATVNADGTITYKPRAGKTGADAFAYTVRDNQGAISNSATVRIDVLR